MPAGYLLVESITSCAGPSVIIAHRPRQDSEMGIILSWCLKAVCSSGFGKVLLLLTAGCPTGLCFRKRNVSRQRLHSFGSVCYLRLNGGWQVQDGRYTLLSGETLSCHVLCM